MVKYNPCGIFLDIISPKVCYCEKCLADMKALGLDAENEADRQKFAMKTFYRYVEVFLRSVRNILLRVLSRVVVLVSVYSEHREVTGMARPHPVVCVAAEFAYR